MDGRGLSGFLNFAVANAGGADANTLGRAVHDGVYGLQVHVPAALRHIVGVADPAAEPGPAPANFTYFRHNDWLLGKLQSIRFGLGRARPEATSGRIGESHLDTLCVTSFFTSQERPDRGKLNSCPPS